MCPRSTKDSGPGDAGAELVGTTLSGYTSSAGSADPEDGPDLRLVERLAAAGVRVVGEGRYRTRAHVRGAFEAGAWSVVVGAAITDPVGITRRLASSTPAGTGQEDTRPAPNRPRLAPRHARLVKAPQRR